ncbi:MAG: glutamate--tRNA ligase [Paenibacillaceae bacterium]
MSNHVRVRYAPSPTGHLHIGGARTALFDYLLARHEGGQFIIRFEDTDQTRHIESGVESQLEGLRWLGVDWDESVDVGGPYAPYRQMERLDLYQPYVQQLLSEGSAYYCYCSEEDLETERAEQEARGEMPSYSGKCRHLTADQIEQYRSDNRKPTVRFRVNENRTISFIDRIREQVEFESNGIGDFIIVRPDGIPTYNFAVVLDDHLMDITHVIRGEEHLSNTPRQILLYEALGFAIPQFAHLSLILNQNRKKMSKRDESIMQFIEQYREQGYLPEAVLNFIVLLGWSPGGEEEIFTKEQLIEQFTMDRLAKSPAVFDTEKLKWMNNQYMKKADPVLVADLAIPHLQKAGLLAHTLDEQAHTWAVELVTLYQEQLNYAAEIVELTSVFFEEVLEYDEEARIELAGDHVPVVLDCFRRLVEETDTYTPEAIGLMLKSVQAETGFKGKHLFMTIRIALTGHMHGRDLNRTLYLLGKDKVLSRLQSTI